MSKKQILEAEIPIECLDSLRFSSLAWTFKMLPSKEAESSTLHVRPFTSTL